MGRGKKRRFKEEYHDWWNFGINPIVGWRIVQGTHVPRGMGNVDFGAEDPSNWYWNSQKS